METQVHPDAGPRTPPAPPVYSWRPGQRQHDLRELWENRELLYFFVWKEYSVRYKQTAIGAVWVVLQPFAFALMFSSVILSKSKAFSMSKGSNFPPLYLGMCFWLMVSSAMIMGSTALLNNFSVLSKVYVPRHIPVLASTILSVVDFLYAIALLPFFCLLTGTPLSAVGFLECALMVIPLALVTHGLVMLLGSAVLRFRDLRFVVPYGVNLLFFFSSALFPLSYYAPRWRHLVLTNPIAIAIDFGRHQAFGVPSALTSQTNRNALIGSIVVMILGGLSFNRTKSRLVEQL